MAAFVSVGFWVLEKAYAFLYHLVIFNYVTFHLGHHDLCLLLQPDRAVGTGSLLLRLND